MSEMSFNKQDMQISEKKWYQALNPAVYAAFLFAFIFGYIIHLYAFTNIIPNADGLSRVYDTQQMTISGRWFLHYATIFNGYVQAPALIGFFSVLFMACASALIAEMLHVRKALYGALIGLFMVAFPSVAYTYLYMFTASAYMFGVLLAVAAVWLAQKKAWGWIPGALILACSVGIYQAYLPVAASLCLCVIIRDCLEKEKSGKMVWKAAARFLVMLIVGMLLYYVILKIFLLVKGLELISYKDINNAGSSLTVKGLLASVWGTYIDFLYYFIVPGTESYITKCAVALNVLLLLLSVVNLITACRRGHVLRDGGKLAAMILAFVLFPLSVNCLYIVSSPAPIMRYAFVMVYILAVMGMSMVSTDRKPAMNAARVLASCIAVLLILGSFQIDNIAYTASETAHRSTERFATSLVTRIESTEGYQRDMPVIIIGTFPEDIYYSDIEAFELIRHYSCDSDSVLMENKHIYYYLNDWLNVQWQEPDESVMIAISNSEEFKAMPLYPSDGSIAIRDGQVIVKLSEQYTPKRPYEIEYENRR